MTTPATTPHPRTLLPAGTVVYTTDRGAAACGDSRTLLGHLPANSVDLIITSPPFALLRKKAYGNEDQAEYVAWLSEFGEAALRVLKDSGSLVVDLGGAYQKGSPTRSLYQFRVLLEFCDSLGYHLAEEFYWHNPSKLPSPIEWVNKRKIRAKDTVNTVWWFSKTEAPKADVRRVLAPYSDRMRQLLENPDAYYRAKERPSGHQVSDGFKNANAGAIPSNLLQIPNSESNSAYLRHCKLLGLSAHPARFPAQLPAFFIDMLTDPGDLVVDIFAGSNTTGAVAEALDRQWLGFELDRGYTALSAVRFLEEAPDTQIQEVYRRLSQGESLHLPDVAEVQVSPPRTSWINGTLAA